MKIAIALALLLGGCSSPQEASPNALALMQSCVMFCTIELETQSEKLNETVNATQGSDVEIGDITSGEQGGNLKSEGIRLSIPGM